MGLTLIDNSPAVKEALQAAVKAFLIEASGELIAGIADNSRRDNGQTINSYEYKLIEGTDEQKAIVGSDYINAVYEEFGTGEYAVKGNGRKGGWWIKVGDGKGEISLKTVKKHQWAGYRYESGEITHGKKLRQTKKRGKLAYVFTKGKYPNKPMQKGYKQKHDIIVSLAQDVLRDKMR